MVTDQQICAALENAVQDIDTAVEALLTGDLDNEQWRARTLIRAIQTDLDIMRKRIENEA